LFPLTGRNGNKWHTLQFTAEILSLSLKCKKLSNQRNEMKKQIKNIGGDWPPMKETLVNNYLQIFVKFVKSTDFTDLQ
jgi:hypothetical protein